MNYRVFLYPFFLLLLLDVHGQDYVSIDAVTGASNIGKGDFQVTGGRAFADHAEIYFTFVQDLTNDISLEETSIKWGTTLDYSDGSLPLFPYVKLSVGTRVLPNLSPNTTYYYWMRGDYYFKGKTAWFDLKSSFVTFNNIVSLVSIEISPANALISIGSTRRFSARAVYSDGSQADVTGSAAWNSGEESIATVDAAGLVTGVASGSVFILASMEGVSDTAQVEVVQEALVLDSITVTPRTGTVGSTGSIQFTATGYYGVAGGQDISSSAAWSSSDTGMALVDSRGLASGVAPGTVTISAEQDGVRADAELTITNPVTLASISLSPDSAAIDVKESYQFSVVGTFSDQSTGPISGDILWMIGDPSLAEISGGNVYGIAPGQTEVFAVYAGLFCSAALTVNKGIGVAGLERPGSIFVTSSPFEGEIRIILSPSAGSHHLLIISPDGRTVHQAWITGEYTWRNSRNPGIYTFILESPATGKTVEKFRKVIF